MNLEKLRENAGYTATQVAKILGIDRKTYYNWLNGSPIPSDKLLELSKLYGVSVDYILDNKTISSKEDLKQQYRSYDKEKLLDIIDKQLDLLLEK